MFVYIFPYGFIYLFIIIITEEGNNHARSTSSESGCKAGLSVVV